MQQQETIHAVMALTDDDFIKSRILTVRSVQVLLDRDLAMLYGVETKVLNQAVKRNIARFPDGFMFQLSHDEMENWKSQFVTSNLSDEDEAGLRMGLRRPPYAFTEQGIAMLSAVLRSATAIEVSIRIIKIFVAMRKALASVAPILSRLDAVERRQIADQSRNEERFEAIFKAMDGGDFPPVVRTEHGYALLPGFVPGEGQYAAILRKHGAPESVRTADVFSLFKADLPVPPPDPYPRFDLDRETALRYLHGDAIRIPDAPLGLLTLTFDGHPLGPGKNLGSRCNNLYPKDRRIRMDIR